MKKNILMARNNVEKLMNEVASNGQKKKMVTATMVAVMSSVSCGFAGIPTIDLNSVVGKIMALVLGFFFVGGIITFLMGVKNIVGGMNDEGGGQDQQAVAKGKSQMFKGGVMAAASSIITLVFGVNPLAMNLF